jgi:hypothetical protein
VWEHLYERVADVAYDGIVAVMGASVRGSVYDLVEEAVRHRVKGQVFEPVRESVVREATAASAEFLTVALECVRPSAGAYDLAHSFAFEHFFHVYLAPNPLQAFAQFNEVVSGYWLGDTDAVIVRRPRLLCCDEAGRLHSASGKCMEYRDGWGFYVWHGVLAPEKAIVAPETLTSDDFLGAWNVEVRRVIQERMGQRFVPELDGVVVDVGSRGTLYEVELPNVDPERVARYVQVQDASTSRTYFLRVPPTMQTADEAVAWMFHLAGAEYQPAHET